MDVSELTIEHRGTELKVRQGILEYLADIDPALEWEQRGFKATGYHQSEIEEFQEKNVQKIEQNLDPEESPKVKDFTVRATSIYQELVQRNFSSLHERLGDTELYFVTGPPRTGGTYLLKNLMELRGDSVKNYHHKLVSDHVPRGIQLGSDYGVAKTQQIIFEWAQWFEWLFDRFKLDKHDFVPKKHIGVIFQLDLFQEILGDNANFIITTRDPGEAYQSYVERFLPRDEEARKKVKVGLWKAAVLPRTNIDEDRWEQLSLPDRFLLYWCACYLEVLNYSDPDRLTVLQFGEEYHQFLQEFAEDRGQHYSPEEFDPTERENLPEFSDHVLEMKKKVEGLWKEAFDKSLY